MKSWVLKIFFSTFHQSLLLPFCFSSSFVFAESYATHELVRRVVVFPMSGPLQLSEAQEESWWKAREVLTESKRFLVASKSFMLQKDVYQPRRELSPADAIILGRLLDAHALVTLFIQDRQLLLRVYDGSVGRLLWSYQFQLQASLPLSEQLSLATEKLMKDFIASIPYQGFVFEDPLKGAPVFTENEQRFFYAHIGVNSGAEPGDQVQLIKIESDRMRMLFGPELRFEVFGEGIIISIERELALVRLERVTQIEEVKSEVLVRLPSEAKRLRELFRLQQGVAVLDTGRISTEMQRLKEQEIEETKPLFASLSWLGNLAFLLLLAF